MVGISPREMTIAHAEREVYTGTKATGGPGDRMGGMYRPGDRVVYTATKHSMHPGPRAEALQPEPNGEGYSYHVRKYWRVLDVRTDGMLVVVTRRGKQRQIPTSDSHLRPARWWESFFLRSRFPQTEEIQSGDDTSRLPPAGAPASR